MQSRICLILISEWYIGIIHILNTCFSQALSDRRAQSRKLLFSQQKHTHTDWQLALIIYPFRHNLDIYHKPIRHYRFSKTRKITYKVSRWGVALKNRESRWKRWGDVRVLEQGTRQAKHGAEHEFEEGNSQESCRSPSESSLFKMKEEPCTSCMLGFPGSHT